ncbi:MAG: hypothetical protein JO227_13125, partial [Acetobacteraceae bacterium]|nr:hypothetical protein [Acetobacteraceae bacterium]
AHVSRMGVLSSLELSPREKLEAVRNELWKDDSAKWVFVPEATPMLEPALAPASTATVLAPQQLMGLAWPAFRDLLWPLLPPPLLLWAFVGWLFGSVGWVGATILGFMATTAASAASVVAIVMWAKRHLNRLEATDPARDVPPDPSKIEKIMESEGRCAQGLLASVSKLKPGRFNSLFRRLALRVAFWFIGQANARGVRPGFLGQIADIHFARWFLLPGTDKLLFWSNYDGAWESYVEDFIQLGHEGVSAIWSNTQDFPRTQDLFIGGASDGDRLRRWARVQMYAPQFWYSAYPDLTLERIRRNAAIRQGLASARTETEVEDWLSLFGSAPPPRPRGKGLVVAEGTPPPAVPLPPPRLDTREVPTLVFGGRSHMRYATCLVIRMSDRPEQCRDWLRKLEPDVTYGADRHLKWALAVALSTAGFDKLGLPRTDLDTFPAVFRNGMTARPRSIALGDVDKDAPENWCWGNEDKPADALLSVYAESNDLLNDTIKDITNAAEASGQKVAVTIALQNLPPKHEPMREPFGFVDGISQPLLRDTPRGRSARNAIHVAELGEFVLGYPDNSGYYPSTPTVAAGLDPHHFLAEFVPELPAQRPVFGTGGSDGRRDLGCNGTYLVIRQLEQDVVGFEDWLTRTADKADPLLVAQVPDPKDRRELIAAKLMGRWRSDGSSLTRHPHPPSNRHGRGADNEFLHGEEDSQGLRCPFGAHIRRANPRDSLDPEHPQAALSISNRHRILRVSRPYQENSGTKGTLFMCLNADIERQFEFIQQTYLRAPSFQALEDEVDPVVPSKQNDRQFTVPTRDGPTVLHGLPDFVRVRGGGYFFMPARSTLRFLAERP